MEICQIMRVGSMEGGNMSDKRKLSTNEKNELLSKVKNMFSDCLDLVLDVFDWENFINNPKTSGINAETLHKTFFHAIMSELKLDYDRRSDLELAVAIAHIHCFSIDLSIYEMIFEVVEDE